MRERRRSPRVILSAFAILVLVTSVAASALAGNFRAAPGASGPPTPPGTLVPGNGTTPISRPLAPSAPSKAVPAMTSGHSGVLNVEYVAPGMTTVDPSVATDSIDAEAILNVYETLVSYNGTSTTSYVPTLATCVPGTSQCTRDYGSSLIGYVGSEPVYWTFVIDQAARFYDPNTTVSWGVYPSDVMFSIARAMAFADTPGVASENGWMFAQALLPFGSDTWDIESTGGQYPVSYVAHYPYNNTPYHILSSMLVNNTAYCPAEALTSEHGCITFVADGGGQSWPYFLQFVASALGGSIESCGWFTAHGGAVPGFTGTGAQNGDGPCELPGGAVTTTGGSFQEFLANPQTGGNPYYWDSLANQTFGLPTENPAIQWGMVGSGPYWGLVDPEGYDLDANPAYHQPSGCSATSGLATYGGTCDPAAAYIPEVIVALHASDTSTLAAMESGDIDFATFLPADASLFAARADEGSLDIYSIPSFTSYVFPFNLDWSSSEFGQSGPSPVQPSNFPATFLSGLAARQVLVQSYPYWNGEYDFTTDALQWLTQSGGPIPKGMANYYPANVTFPSENPDSNPSVVGGAAWWWAQGTTPGSPYFDQDLANCTTSNPCKFPIVGIEGDTTLDTVITGWIYYIEQITDNRLQPTLDDAQIVGLGSIDTIVLSQLDQAPGSGAFPVWPFGGAGQFASQAQGSGATESVDSLQDMEETIFDNWEVNPTVAPAAVSTSALSSDAVAASAGAAPCTGSYSWGEPPAAYPADPTDFLTAAAYPDNDLTWPDAVCEELETAPYENSSCGYDDGSFASLAYWANEGEIPNDCQGVAYSAALTWMENAAQLSDPATRALEYNLVEHILNGLALYVYMGQGTVNLAVAPWISESSVNTNPVIGGAGDQLWYEVRYAPDTVNFVPEGLPKYVNWTVSAGAPFPVTAPNTTVGVVVNNYSIPDNISFTEPSGELTYAITSPSGYVALRVTGPGSPTLTSVNLTHTVTNLTVIFGPTEPVMFDESGLPKGTAWSVTFAGSGQTSSSDSIIFNAINGTYAFNIGGVPGYTATPVSGNVTVDGATTVRIVYLLNYTVTFQETGLPTGGAWEVWLDSSPGESSTNATIVFELPNGSYSFQALPLILDYQSSPTDGSFTVQGAPVVRSITFTPLTYNVTFSETGLASGTTWHVLLDGIGLSGSGASLTYPMWVGTYAYTVGVPTGCSSVSPSAGNVVVTNSAVSVSVRFSPSGCGSAGGGGGGSGGGCVNNGTPILTPQGYVPVQLLKPGAPVVEYNFTSGHLTVGKLVSASTTAVDELIDIDQGWLYLTPTDQPIYVANGTFEGWLRDPQDLTPHDRVFDPVTSSWILVVSVALIHEETVVYDVVTTGFNNFVGNGALLDLKACEACRDTSFMGLPGSEAAELLGGGTAAAALLAVPALVAYHRRRKA